MLSLTINGKKVEAEENATILNVAKELGIEIPTLCYHTALEPYQVCRICMVEIIKEGKSQLVPACGYKVEEGIEVFTESDKVIKRRKMLINLILAEAPNSQKVREIAQKLGISKPSFFSKREKECILCGLCVRVCNEVMKIGTITFAYRGIKREVTTPYNEFSPICSTCGACTQICPTGAIKLEEITENKVTPIFSEFDVNLTTRPCIYIPFPQAVPNKPVIDRKNCMYFKNNNCRICEKVCQPGAINYNQEDKIVEEEVGAIVVATGYELYPIEKIREYGGGKYKDVINGLQFERLLSSSGPTQGEIKRPSDGKIPKRVVFVSCVGSRDPEHHLPYCSKICCMYSAKHAMLYKHRVPDGEAIVFYIDTRAGGKDYEEFLVRAREEGKVLYIRGKVSRIFKKGDELIVWSVNTLTGEQIQVKCDMVVLSMAIVSSSGTVELARKLKIQTNQYGFLNEAHPKLRPLESLSTGFYLAGCAQAQKDIPDTVAQASGAASKVLEMFSQKELLHEPTVAIVDENICRGCGICVSVCPYDAKELVSKDKKKVVKINEILCEGCGSCVSVCPSKAMQQKNFRNLQILRMIEVMS
jgi:heterodisulfide reductase subunit A